MTNYEPFMARLVASLVGKKKRDDDLTDQEIKAIVAVEFVAAVIEVADKTDNYMMYAPIDLYRESRHYKVPVPEGFRLGRVKKIETNGYKFNASVNEDTITLPCCPSRDVDKAWFAHFSVVPRPSANHCEFDSDFIDEHFETILLRMQWSLSRQNARQWSSLGFADRLHIEYKRAIRSHRRLLGKITMKKGSLTDDSVCTPAGESCHFC